MSANHSIDRGLVFHSSKYNNLTCFSSFNTEIPYTCTNEFCGTYHLKSLNNELAFLKNIDNLSRSGLTLTDHSRPFQNSVSETGISEFYKSSILKTYFVKLPRELLRNITPNYQIQRLQKV